jgi:hypothetical protein
MRKWLKLWQKLVRQKLNCIIKRYGSSLMSDNEKHSKIDFICGEINTLELILERYKSELSEKLTAELTNAKFMLLDELQKLNSTDDITWEYHNEDK